MRTRLLITEDDHSLNEILAMHFEDQGFDVLQAESIQAAQQILSSTKLDLVLLDQQLPDGTGLDLIPRIRDTDEDTAIVMMTGQHDLELAIEAIKRGAADFIHKPVNTAALTHVIDRVLENQRLSRKVNALQTQQSEPPINADMIGSSAAMLEVSKEIALSAESHATILILGESGVGKEVVSRLIHQHSGRSGPFIAVNCAAIVDTLLESELFGHVKGAFSGASESKPGKFELANGGTLFLDEIGELALPLQAKLLRALQEQVIERVGGTREIRLDARIIAATNRDLDAEVAAGRFREDLRYRLDVVSITIPPLRDRREDIPLLAKGLMERIARQIHKPAPTLSDEALDILQAWGWPGNVRELENTLTHAMVHARGRVLTPDLFSSLIPTAIADTAPPGQTARPLRSLDEVEAEHIQIVLRHTGGHKGKTCDILGISRPALDRKIKKYDLQVPS
ncbi:MAG TPA: sigma-54-dependent Fis family transcriptional regulator [Chromatiaceae bacterium]|nr:sigma-54-dependent Fis family transcriptional regulator [Chromatiaceae bacterium]